MQRSECDPFLQGYLDAALFTTDPEPPSGVDYVESGRADELYPKLPDWWIAETRKRCADFVTMPGVAELLSRAGDPWQNGSDLFYTSAGHGVGYLDRGYPDEVSEPLVAACRKMGEHYLMAEDFVEYPK